MMLQTHNNMRELGSNFKAFELLVIAPEGGFDATFHVRNMGAPFEPGSPEDMALWRILNVSNLQCSNV